MKKELLSTKVTYINGKYYCRLLKDGEVHSEMVCKHKEDVGLCLKEMLRWYDKCGFPYSRMADASRHRGKNYEQPRGTIKKKY